MQLPGGGPGEPVKLLGCLNFLLPAADAQALCFCGTKQIILILNSLPMGKSFHE
jgi:hypothetical protein